MHKEPEMIAVSRLRILCEVRGGTFFTANDGAGAYHMPNGQTVRIPQNNARIPEVVVHEIAVNKLEMHEWEYDYWLSEQDNVGFETFKIPATAVGPLSPPVKRSMERADGLSAYHPGISHPPQAKA